MNRSCYSEDLVQWDLIRWRGAVKSAIRGRRGQAILRDLLQALDALPEPALISEALISDDGCCAIGSLALKRGVDVSDLDPEEDPDFTNAALSERFDAAEALIREIEFINDGWFAETPEQRFVRVRSWVESHIEVKP